MLGKIIQNQRSSSYFTAVFTALLTIAFIAIPGQAHAQVGLIAANIVASISDLPGLISAFSYLLGLLFGVRGVLKLRAHVENPGNGSGQTPLRTPMISFIVGGALFALPILIQAATVTITGGVGAGFGAFISTALTGLSGLFGGGLTVGTGDDFSFLLASIGASLSTLPGLIAAVSYLLGLVLVVMGAIKVKEHVETPEQVKVSEGVIRLLAGGALLGIPTIYSAMYNAIDVTGGAFSVLSILTGAFASDFIGSCTAGTAGIGQRICGIVTHTGLMPAFLSGISYLFGLVMGVWGILKIRDHVLNPQQTGVFEGISRLIAGGAFFALPFVVQTFTNSIVGGGVAGSAITKYNYGNGTLSGYVSTLLSSGSCPTGVGLDAMMLCFASDVLGPIHVVLNFFAFIAGTIFIMIGISRLIKGAQEGSKAPGGLGTLMTFAIGGALVSYNDIIRAATTTFTGSSTTQTFAKMQYTTGMSTNETAAAHAVITSIVKFMIVIGIISFVRGLFIVRSVAEGNQQASMMAGVTHLIGGTLAVNLGPVLNAVQSTLGTATYGIKFS